MLSKHKLEKYIGTWRALPLPYIPKTKKPVKRSPVKTRVRGKVYYLCPCKIVSIHRNDQISNWEMLLLLEDGKQTHTVPIKDDQLWGEEIKCPIKNYQEIVSNPTFVNTEKEDAFAKYMENILRENKKYEKVMVTYTYTQQIPPLSITTQIDADDDIYCWYQLIDEDDDCDPITIKVPYEYITSHDERRKQLKTTMENALEEGFEGMDEEE